MSAKIRIKMDFSDIIFYIVLSAIGILSSTVSQKTKKKAEEAKQRKVQQSSGRGVEPVPMEVVPETTPAKETDYSTPDVLVSLDDIFKALREQVPLESVIVQETTPEEEIVIEEPTPEPAEEAVRVTFESDLTQNEISDSEINTDEERNVTFAIENVDWRQAVIASEILNRKY